MSDSRLLVDSKPRMPGTRRGRHQVSAFTLIEVLVVVSLLGLLASISWPNIQGQIIASELPESADRLRSALFMARSDAVLEHRRFRVRFPPEQQQPVIEWERDPILEPGVFEPAPKPWANEPILMADVQVHEVTLGRPIWTRPLELGQSPDELAKEEDKRLSEDEQVRRDLEAFLRGAKTNDGVEQDPKRQTIVFEVDGSTDWATFIVSRVRPEDELEETARQIWIVVDGRTGLAYFQKQVTDDDLSTPEFYVDRKKLEPPDTADLDNLTMTIGGQPNAQDSTSLSDALAGSDTAGTDTGQMSINDTAGGGAIQVNAPGTQGQDGGPRKGGQGNTAQGGNSRQPSKPPPGTGNEPVAKPPPGGPGGTKPDQKIDNSNLTPEEKEQMKKWLGGKK